MNQELSKNLVCICVRNGVQIWIEKERAENLRNVLNKLEKHHFIEFEKEFINTADIIGIFSPESMDELTRRKNGQWKCKTGFWHDRGKKCACEENEKSGDELARASRGF